MPRDNNNGIFLIYTRFHKNIFFSLLNTAQQIFENLIQLGEWEREFNESRITYYIGIAQKNIRKRWEKKQVECEGKVERLRKMHEKK